MNNILYVRRYMPWENQVKNNKEFWTGRFQF